MPRLVDAGTTDDDASRDGPQTRGFQIELPVVTIQPGQQITHCYYVRTPNSETLAIKKWSSTIDPTTHHVQVFTYATEVATPGTVVDKACDFGTGGNQQKWIYSAYTGANELVFPADDGTGRPLGLELSPGTPVALEIESINTSATAMTARVSFDAEAHDPGVSYTRTHSYVAVNTLINIPPGAVNDQESQSCPVQAGVQFWMMSMHARQQATLMRIEDSGSIVFSSNDWEHPGARIFAAAPFHVFSSGALTYICRYNNTKSNEDRTVTFGQSSLTDEICQETGYYFPATDSTLCLDNVVVR